MMVIKKILMGLGLLSVAHTVVAMDNCPCGPRLTPKECAYLSGSGNTFDGQIIDPDTVLKLLSQVPSKSKRGYAADDYEDSNPVEPLSKADRKAVEQFIKNNKLQDLLSGASYQHTVFCGDLAARKAVKADIDRQLSQAEIPNLADNSFVFEVPGTDLIIKKSMLSLSRQNVVYTSEAHKWEGRPEWVWGRLLSEGEFCRWSKELDGHTYQNTSRAMVYLRALEALSVLDITDIISIPDTFLVHIPGRPKDLDDTNYVVVERSFGTQREDWDKSKLAIDRATILAMVKLTAATGFWTMNHAASVVDGRLMLQPSKFVYHDLELPMDHVIDLVLHKDVQNFRGLVKIGWNEIENQIITPYLKAHPDKQKKVDALLAEKHALQKEIMACWK